VADQDSEGLSHPTGGGASVESYLIKHLGANPGLRFGALVHAAQTACHVSRITVARHLARLIRFGDIAQLPDHTYCVVEPTAPTQRSTLEFRRSEETYLVLPDGTARDFIHEEFRVNSGKLEHMELNVARSPRMVDWWSTTPSQISDVASIHTPTRMFTLYFEFAKPLIARNATWQTICWSMDLPDWYRMSYASKARSHSARIRHELATEAESIHFASEAPRFAQRLSADALLRLQVVFPLGYPIGPARSRVVFHSEPKRIDTAEDARLMKLSEDDSHQDGLRRIGSKLVLSVPRPRLDRIYKIEWALPTTTQRNRWLSAESRRLSKLMQRPSSRRSSV
jgi:hypothetical protein